MTLTTLIILNAILAAIVVCGILFLLGYGIYADAIARMDHIRRPRAVPRKHDRLAA